MSLIEEMMAEGWSFTSPTMTRSTLVKIAKVFVTVNGPGNKVKTVRDLRAATKGFVPLEDNGIQALSDDGEPMGHWFLRHLIRAIDEAAMQD